MKYIVRDRNGGELTFRDFGQVQEAWLVGMIEPDDQIREESSTRWRKAGALPELRDTRPRGAQAWGGVWLLWVVLGVVGATASLRLLSGPTLQQKLFGVVVLLADAIILFKVTRDAHRRGRRG